MLLEELGLCRGLVRIDMVVVNGALHGYEIKSDRDSLRRLAGQAEIYSRVLDRATLVVGDRHRTEAMELVPSWWGVLGIEAGRCQVRFKLLREGRQNPERHSRSLVELLWLDDAIGLLARQDAVRGVRSKPRRVVWDRVCEHFTVDQVAAEVRTRLKARAALQGPPSPS